MPPTTRAKPIGLAIVGGGRIGQIRGEIAARHPSVGWLGLAEIRADHAKEVATRLGADFVTTDHRELLARPEVTAAVIATDEHLHVDPILAAVERRLPLLIEKPLATTLRESARVRQAIQHAGVDAVVGYTQRFRRRFLAAKEKVRTGQLGDVTLVTSRAFMNRLVALDNYRRTDRPASISPMVISGTHALDVVMWLLEGKTPAEVYARSVDRVLGPTVGGIDATAGLVTMTDGTLYHLNISWALPTVWPGSVYSLEIGIVGTEGVLTIDDTHRDVLMATTRPQPAGYTPEATRQVDFLTSYPPGSVALGELWGPMREETNAWLGRLALGHATPHATAGEAHDRLMLTKALDLSARRRRPIALPITSDDEERA
jgi:myo-inositol 2-dehydrogenase/D-chiro-inositol 1-dehydrogenase